jgi:hypothetical protein
MCPSRHSTPGTETAWKLCGLTGEFGIRPEQWWQSRLEDRGETADQFMTRPRPVMRLNWMRKSSDIHEPSLS